MPAKRCRYKGITYDSKAEAGYHVELKAKKKRKRQEEWVVVDIKGQVPKTVTRRDGSKRRVAGGKGWTAFRLRCELLKANYGIDVQVIEGAPYTRMASDLGIK